jgi:UDP-N-acetyl-D-mannosaminuronic acid transferase (WecB/TagA/CpsF family)
MNQANFANLTLTSGGIEVAVNQILDSAFGPKNHSVTFHLVNSYTCQLFAEMPEPNPLMEIVSINFPDGFWLAKYLRAKSGTSDFVQIRGPNLFKEVLQREETSKLRQLCLGSSEETLQSLASVITEEINTSTPKNSLFTISPPYKPMTEADVESLARFVENNKIDLIWHMPG